MEWFQEEVKPDLFREEFESRNNLFETPEKEEEIPLGTVNGPISLVRFTFGKHIVYMFGDSHEQVDDHGGLSIDWEGASSGEKNTSIGIDRLIFAMYGKARRCKTILNLFLELNPADPGKVGGIGINASRFEKLFYLLKPKGIVKTDGTVKIHSVDFRINEKDFTVTGNREFTPPNRFSDFYRLFLSRNYDEITLQFPIYKANWDVEILKNAFRDELEKLPNELKELIEGWNFKSISGDYVKFIADRMTTNQYEIAYRILKFKIIEFHLWFADIPALSYLFNAINTEPGLSVLYLGADHVSNLIPFIARIDPLFKVHVGENGRIDLPMDMREEILENI